MALALEVMETMSALELIASNWVAGKDMWAVQEKGVAIVWR